MLSLLGVLVCQGIVRFYGFGVSRRCPLLVVLVCDSVVRFLGFGPSRCCPLLGVLVCHGVVHFWGFWFVTVLSASGALGLSGCCLGPFLGNLVSDHHPTRPESPRGPKHAKKTRASQRNFAFCCLSLSLSLSLSLCLGLSRYEWFWPATAWSASRGSDHVSSMSRSFGQSHSCCPLLGVWFVMALSAFRGSGLSRCCPFPGNLVCHGVVRFLGVLVCHGVVRFKGFWSVTVLSASSRHRPLLGVWSVTVLSASRGLVCHGSVRF